MDDLTHRKPARRMADIPAEVLTALNAGCLQTKNLTEWLAVDRRVLLEKVTKEWNRSTKEMQVCLPMDELWTDELADASALKQSMAVGRTLTYACRVGDAMWKWMSTHPSDIVREWSAILIGLDSNLSFARKLAWVKPLADDDNSGLREIAWLALRPDVAADPVSAIKALVPWTGSRAERLRRYASEITRPCGVWTTHIALLKERPELGLPVLEPLMSDESKYVQNSVGNWLNDASKSQPKWVRNLVQSWQRKSNLKETSVIAKRALRTIVAADSSS